jgi:ketosteroid isomerase-like protein
MKKSSVIFLLALFSMFGIFSGAQVPETPDRERAAALRQQAAEAEVQRDELLNLQKETVRALQLHNGTFFNRVFSDDFLWTSPSGTNMDKAAYVSAVQNSDDKYASFVVSDIRVRVFQDTAVVTCLWSSRGTSDGSSFFRQSRVINVYVYGQRGWKVVASQETRLPG